MIEFTQPGWFGLFTVVLLMTAVGVWLARWRQQAKERFAGPQAQRWQASPSWPALLFLLLASVLIVIAAAMPTWGSNTYVRDRQGIDFVIALDVSQSMLANDVQPNRLTAAQDELEKLVQSQHGSRFGLVLFAGTAAQRSPLTTDTSAMSQLIRRAGQDAGLVSSGSDLAAALQTAGALLASSENTGKAVLIVSDGESTNQGVTEAQELSSQGIVVFAAGVGTEQGGNIITTAPNGQPTILNDASGAPIVTRFQDAPLRSIAFAGGGSYLRIDAGNSLQQIGAELDLIEQTPLGSDTVHIGIPRFQPFIIAALILLVESWLIPLRLIVPAARQLGRLRPHGGMASVFLLAVLVGACSSGSGDSLRERNAAANRLYEQGDFQGALEAYQQLLRDRPDVLELSVNAGNALHRLGNFDRAVAETQRALPPIDPKLGAITLYNLGNHLMALERLDEAFVAYRASLLLDPNDQDAKHNLELTLARLMQPDPNGAEQGPGEPQPGQPEQQGEPGQPEQPQPGEQNQQPGQPEPGPTQQQADEQLQQAIEDANEDGVITVEEANAILDAIREQQRTQRPAGTPGQPDRNY